MLQTAINTPHSRNLTEQKLLVKVQVFRDLRLLRSLTAEAKALLVYSGNPAFGEDRLGPPTLPFVTSN